MWDLSLPGYKYLGPGNSLDKGEPNNNNDLIAYIHDIEYGKIIEMGGNPYLLWSKADAEAYKKFTTEDYGGALGKVFFGLKSLAHSAGLIGTSLHNLRWERYIGQETGGLKFNHSGEQKLYRTLIQESPKK